MARKRVRVNLPLLVSIGSVFLVAGAGGLYAYKHRHPRNPAPYIVAGDEAMKQGDYDKAAANYQIASGLMPQDAPLHIKLGRAYLKSQKPGTDGLVSAVKEFTSAEELDPKSKDAWGGLLETSEVSVEYFENHPTETIDKERLPQSINVAREAAVHLKNLEPDNLDAQAAGPIFVIRTWLLNLTMPESQEDLDTAPDKRLTPDGRVEKAIADLTKMMRDHPENDRIPFWIARARIHQGQLALTSEQPGTAPGLFSEAEGEFDPSIAAKPDLIGLYLNKAEIIRLLMNSDPSAVAAVDYRAKQRETLDKAQSIADPKNRTQYLAAKQQWARVLGAYEPYSAELVYKDMISKFPEEIGLRLSLAQLLQHDATRRNDALAVLDAIPSLPGSSVTNAVQRENWEMNVAVARLLRADIETDQIQVMPQGKARDVLSADIQTSLDSANKLYMDDPRLLRVRGRFQLANGQIIEAIATLTRAVEKMSASGAVDYDLLRTEANAYRAGGQAGKAIELLEKAIADPLIANNPDIHMSLAELYLENKDLAKARTMIEWLALRLPDNLHVIELEIAALGPAGDPAKAKELFDRLPEKTPSDLVSKQRTAGELGFKDEQIRLLLLMNKSAPGDVQLVFGLTNLLESVKREDEARKLIDACMKLNPGNKSLSILLAALNGESKQDIQKNEESSIAAMTDPFDRYVKMAELYQTEQRPDDQMVELQKALAIRPNDTYLLQEIFQLHLAAGRYDKAEQMLPHMTELKADDCDGLLLKCKLCLAKQDVEGALTAGRQMTKDFGTLAGSWEMYGEALQASGQLDQACQQYVTALSLQATNLDASRKLIQCSVMQGKLEDAKAYIKQARTRFPDDTDYLEMAVQYEINWGNPELVLEDLNSAIHSHPKDRRIYAMTADALLASMRSRASRGDGDAAAAYLTKATELFQTAVSTWPDDLRFSNGLAQMQMDAKNLPAAEETLKTVSERPRWKDQAVPLVLLARVYVQANKLDLAESTLKQALTDDPKSVDARMVLSDVKVLQQKYDDALIALQPALASFQVREKYIDLMLGLNKGAMAENEMNEAIKADPSNSALIDLRLHVYDAEGLYDQGLRSAKDALAADHNNTMAYYWRGKFEASGPTPNYDQAMTDLRMFRDSAPTDVNGRILIAAILDAQGDRDGAIHELEAAMSFSQQNRNIRLSLLRDYLTASPAKTAEADRLLKNTISLPIFAHDPEFESKAALVAAQKGDSDRAISEIQDAMQYSKDKAPLLGDYFSVLLETRHYDTLLSESEQYSGNPKTGWFVFNDRGIARAATGDFTGAAAEFQTAMDRCGIERGESAANAIVQSIVQFMKRDTLQSGIQAALDLVLPRAQNSVAWKLIAVDLYVDKNDIPNGVKLMESALPSLDSLAPTDQLHMLKLAAGIYYRCDPPQVEKCTAMYNKILAIAPNDVDSMNDMACVLSDLDNNPQGALVWSQKAYDIVEKSGHVNNRIYDTQGWILIQLNRAAEGVEILHHAIEAADFPEAHYHLARGYLKMQLPEEAQRQLNNANTMIQNLVAKNAPVDATLKPKIDAALKEADQMVKDKTQAKAIP